MRSLRNNAGELALRIFMRTLAAWLRLRGRRLGLRDGRTGAVACLQRFGGILNLNPHIHALLPDGLFVPGPTPDANTAPAGPGLGPGVSGRLVFVPLPPPSDREFADLAVKLADRLGALARRRFKQAEEELPGLDADTLPLRTSAAESVQVPGQRPRTFDEAREPRLTVLPDKPLCSRINGFSLHAARTVEPDDRAGLERLARYCLRAPYSLDRLSLTTDGMVRYKLYRPWPTPTGRTEILLEPLAFMRRLAALLPGPYVNMIRYYGVFANRSKCRDRLPLPPLKTDAAPADAGTDPGRHAGPGHRNRNGHPGQRQREGPDGAGLYARDSWSATQVPFLGVPPQARTRRRRPLLSQVPQPNGRSRLPLGPGGRRKDPQAPRSANRSPASRARPPRRRGVRPLPGRGRFRRRP